LVGFSGSDQQKAVIGSLTRILTDPEDFWNDPEMQHELKATDLWRELRGKIFKNLEPKTWDSNKERAQDQLLRIDGKTVRFRATDAQIHALDKLTAAAWPSYALRVMKPAIDEAIEQYSRISKTLHRLAAKANNLADEIESLDSGLRACLWLPDIKQLSLSIDNCKTAIASRRQIEKRISFIRQEYMTSFFAAHAEEVLTSLYEPNSRLAVGIIRHAIGQLENRIFGQGVSFTDKSHDCPAVKEQIHQWKMGEYKRFFADEQIRKFLSSND
jgi:hypothetical protein